MKYDGVVRISLLLCTSILVLAALYFSRVIMAPVAFALFVVAIAWPLQSALQARIPQLLALVVTIVVTLAIIAVLVLLVIWGFGLVVQWLINNTDRFQTLYAQASEWLDGHGVAYGFHDYKTEGIAKDKLKRWSDELGWETLLNRAGTTFRKLPDGDREGLNERKALALMLAQPSMIKRPVLEVGGRLLVGFKPEIYAKEVAGKGARGK